jgi:PLP dependent protein
MDEALQDRLDRVRERIESARSRAGRGDPVTLVAVTKNHPVEAVRSLARLGVQDIGENRVQEMEDKASALGAGSVRWHLIGRLQRNKVRKALPLVELLHSLDSLRLAEAVSAEAVRREREVRVLVQVNVSGEETKGGFEPPEAAEAIERICALPGVRVEGLMTMAPFTGDERVLRATFARARELRDAVVGEVAAFEGRHLSMGMSNDFEIAIEEGSTLVRLGTVLLGERQP